MSAESPEPRATASTRFAWPTPRDWLLAAVVLVSALLYFPLNHSPAHPHVLTTSLDERIPVVSVFAIPYIAFLPIFWLTVIFAFLTRRPFASFALAIAAVYLASDIVFALYPTYAPRPHHVSGLVRFVYNHDEPYNDLPSGHTASAVLLALYLWPEKGLWRAIGLTLAALVIPATLLIKQHSIAGAAGGIALALAAWYAVRRFRRTTSP
jgi:hypothetical protein